MQADPHPDPSRYHRELVQISALAILAVLAFWGTIAVHGYALRQNIRDAEQWYRRGEDALAAGDSRGAVNALQRAVLRNRTERIYALALGQAFERSNDPDSAQRVLLSLRESAPDDTNVNLALARLNAARGDVPDALRYYRNALYAPATAADATLRRTTRLELIRYLLANHDRGRALAELLSAANDSPNDASSALELGRLFGAAGEDRRALEQFRIALRVAPRDTDVLAAAGAAAFQLGSYQEARRYLAEADPTAANRELLAVVTAVITLDPSAPRLSTAERRIRLLTALEAVHDRLLTCAPAANGGAEQRQLEKFSADLRRIRRLDSETVDAGIDLIERGETAAAGCRQESPVDRALILVAHNSAPR